MLDSRSNKEEAVSSNIKQFHRYIGKAIKQNKYSIMLLF